MSAKQPRYELADKAHKKLLLHAFKYPQHSVNGVLIGKPQDTSDSAKSKSIVITDYIPLFHGCTLSPMLEGAMMLVCDQLLKPWLFYPSLTCPHTTK